MTYNREVSCSIHEAGTKVGKPVRTKQSFHVTFQQLNEWRSNSLSDNLAVLSGGELTCGYYENRLRLTGSYKIRQSEAIRC